MLEYYDLETNRTYFLKDSLVYFFQHEGGFEHLCFHFWREHHNWVQNFGKVPQGIGWQWKNLNIKPCPQAPSKWITEHIAYNKQHWKLDLEKSLFVLKEKIYSYFTSE